MCFDPLRASASVPSLALMHSSKRPFNRTGNNNIPANTNHNLTRTRTRSTRRKGSKHSLYLKNFNLVAMSGCQASTLALASSSAHATWSARIAMDGTGRCCRWDAVVDAVDETVAPPPAVAALLPLQHAIAVRVSCVSCVRVSCRLVGVTNAAQMPSVHTRSAVFGSSVVVVIEARRSSSSTCACFVGKHTHTHRCDYATVRCVTAAGRVRVRKRTERTTQVNAAVHDD